MLMAASSQPTIIHMSLPGFRFLYRSLLGQIRHRSSRSFIRKCFSIWVWFLLGSHSGDMHPAGTTSVELLHCGLNGRSSISLGIHVFSNPRDIRASGRRKTSLRSIDADSRVISTARPQRICLRVFPELRCAVCSRTLLSFQCAFWTPWSGTRV